MQYVSTAFLREKSPGESFRGPRRVTARQGSVVGRRYWMRRRSKQPRSLHVSDEEGNNVLKYFSLVPRNSTFASVTETCLLYAPQVEDDDVRRDRPDFNPDAKTPFGDPNYGRPVYTIGIKPQHGSDCDCYECTEYPSDKLVDGVTAPQPRNFRKEHLTKLVQRIAKQRR